MMESINPTVIAAIAGAFASIFVAVLTSIYNNNKNKLEKDKWFTENHKSIDQESNWITDVDKIATLPAKKISEKQLLKVREALGICEMYYGKNNKNGVDYVKIKKDENNNYFYKFIKLFNNRKINSISYYLDFKNNAIMYIERIYNKKTSESVFKGLSEKEAENVRMICLELKQDRWDTYKIDERRTALASNYKFLFFFSSMKNSIISIIILLFSLVLCLALRLSNFNHIIIKLFNNLPLFFLLIFLLCINVMIGIYIFSSFYIKLKKLEELESKRNNQRKVISSKLK